MSHQTWPFERHMSRDRGEAIQTVVHKDKKLEAINGCQCRLHRPGLSCMRRASDGQRTKLTDRARMAPQSGRATGEAHIDVRPLPNPWIRRRLGEASAIFLQ